MQDSESVEIISIDEEERPNSDIFSAVSSSEREPNDLQPSSLDEGDPIEEDVSGKTWELSVLGNSSSSDDLIRVKGLYIYKNTFNLIPQSIGGFEKLKTLKFFANEINLFPSETGNLVDLEQLQVKLSSPGVSGLPFQKLKALKDLELFTTPPRPGSAFPLLLSEIANLKCLKKLAVCHFSIRYLPQEIGCLNTLEELDISFNKLKNLPKEINCLEALRSLKVANNKLEELPIGLSLLQKLEALDISNNRLTSLGALELVSMKTLKTLDVRYNKLLNCCDIPSWICCNLEGNGKDVLNNDFISCSSVSSLSSDNKSKGFSAPTRIGKEGWKRLKARRDCLKSIKNHTSDDQQHMNVDECNDCKLPDVALEELSSSSVAECESSSVKEYDESDEHGFALCFSDEDENFIYYSVGPKEGCDSEDDASTSSSFIKNDEHVGETSTNANASKCTTKTKRQFEDDLENFKPRKSQKPLVKSSYVSNKYSTESFCSIHDRLPDGFYDAGRGCPFMPLDSYELHLCLDSREVILVDRDMDDELNVIVSSAKKLVSCLNEPSSLEELGEHLADDNLQRASLLAFFVSNWLGGSDRSNLAVKMRKAWSGSNYQKPFVCSCETGNGDSGTSSEQILGNAESLNFADLCEKSLRMIKQARNSVIVPIGILRWGICRHRAVLMKYLCDRMVPPIPCELVRGYLDFTSHAWNIVPVRKNGLMVRMVVDACDPTEIREETDPELFCRYIPSSRINLCIASEDTEKPSCSFPFSSLCEKIETSSSSLMRCKLKSGEAVAKVRTLNTNGISDEEVKKFERKCLGEVRILGALMKHSCIVEIYGHQISSKWVPSEDGNSEQRILQSAIWLEYIEGGSLKSYIEKVLENGEKCLQVKLALFIARNVACALAELHSKDIIHRDIKSENILIDLDRKRIDGTPVVKLCDFDIAVPLRSCSHTCCIAHLGIPRPDVCVGTPRWMAPEVLQAWHQQKKYGLEVDIWSYGCLILELLTLEVPYAGLTEPDMHDLLRSGQRPQLTYKLEALVSSDEPVSVKFCTELDGVDTETEILRFLVYLFRQCTRGNPKDRPTAAHLYEELNTYINFLATSTK